MLSIVIPCYNEAKVIKKNIDIISSYLKAKIDFELIVVNDGSKDNTYEVIKNIAGIKAITYEKNGGKGFAVKKGIEAARGEYVLFMDADLSTNLASIDLALTHINSADIVIASRHLKASVLPVKRSFIRRLMSAFSRSIINARFRFNLSDTQCGFKLFKTCDAQKIITKQKIYNFAFDVEYLYIAKLNGLTIKEIPCVWRDVRGSTISPLKSSLRFIKDLKKIKKNKKDYIFNE